MFIVIVYGLVCDMKIYASTGSPRDEKCVFNFKNLKVDKSARLPCASNSIFYESLVNSSLLSQQASKQTEIESILKNLWLDDAHLKK